MARAGYQRPVWAKIVSGDSLHQVITGDGLLCGNFVFVAQGRGVIAVLSEILTEALILGGDGILHRC